MQSSEEAYQALIDRAFDHKTDLIISNGKAEHARYLIAKFLRNAERVVRIYTGSLSRYVGDDRVPVYASDDVLEATRHFLSKRNSLLLIATENALDVDESGRHPLLEAAKSMRTGNRELGGILWAGRASAGTVAHFGEIDYRHHWQVMDEQAYRLEHDPANTKAHANFGTPEVAGSLARLFDQVLLHAEPIEVIAPTPG